MQEPIKKVRVACYVRHSDPIHIEDQILQCKKVADENGWVLDDHIYIDDQPGAATHREGLEALLAEIKNPDREFDGVVIEETSRLARSLTDLLRICRILTYYGGFMFFAVQLLDSRDPMFSELMYMGTQDEVYLARRQAVAVRRGQVGRIKKGLIGNGGCFGYDHVPIEDPTQMRRGLPAMVGVKGGLNENEAALIRHIFDLRGRGLSYRQIANKLNQDGAPLLMDHIWTASRILKIINNRRYLGIIPYGHTRRLRDPQSRKIVVRHLPCTEWLDQEVPELRIVSDEQWRKAHGRRQDGDVPLADISDPRA